MKNIVVPREDFLHAVLKRQAQSEQRTLGRHVKLLAMKTAGIDPQIVNRPPHKKP